jgi:hypothetical protein
VRATCLVGLIAAVMIAGAALPALSVTPANCSKGERTARECKERDCRRLFESNLAACNELPANKACVDMAKSQRGRCDQFCDANYSDAGVGCPEK